nr:hypothetical protein [Acidobacteriota bacterium]
MRAFFLCVLAASASLAADEPGMVDRYLTQTAEALWKERDAKIASLRNAADVHARQNYVRKTILKEIGGFPERTPLNARTTGRLERDGYSVEKVIYESQPRFYVTANVYVPSTGDRPFAAVLG